MPVETPVQVVTADQALLGLQAAARSQRKAELAVREAVRLARSAGLSWARISAGLDGRQTGQHLARRYGG